MSTPSKVKIRRFLVDLQCLVKAFLHALFSDVQTQILAESYRGFTRVVFLTITVTLYVVRVTSDSTRHIVPLMRR